MKTCTTKQDFQQLLSNLLAPLKPFYLESGAGLDIGHTGSCYPQRTILMEAFSRPLWGLVPFWAGGGAEDDFAALYRRGLVNGTNPDHPDYWGGFRRCDQKYVEMAALSYALLFAPDKVWTLISDAEKAQIARWLNGINEFDVADNNWQFFRILVNVALKKAGQPYDAEKLEKSLNRIEDFYLGDGWYQDGLTAQKDYYIPFALHFYSLVYVLAMENEDSDRCRRYRARAAEFAKQFVYWFSEEGPALPYGRSLTYRFAQAAFWSIAAVTGLDGFTPGQVKGILFRHLNWWMQQPIFDNCGILTIGYRYPNLHMAESYNAPGSPYWSLKAFAFLMIPDDAPFWQAEIEPLPELEPLKLLRRGEMLVQRRPHDVVAYVPGVHHENNQVHVPEKYSKFAYSTHFGFSVPRSGKRITEAVPDSMLAFEISGHIFVRRLIDSFTVEEHRVVSTWSPFEGITVTSELLPQENGHKRIHHIKSSFACRAWDCGFAVSTRDSGYHARKDDTTAWAANDTSRCTVRSLGVQGAPAVIWGEPNTNLVTQTTELPAICYTIPAGETTLETEITTEVTE